MLTKEFKEIVPNTSTLSLFNTKDIIHKLSHQHLYTKFWIVKTSEVSKKTIPWNGLEKYPVPILIDKFLKAFINKNK